MDYYYDYRQLDKKEKYSIILVLFQLCEQERHFKSQSTHPPTNKKPHEGGTYIKYFSTLLYGSNKNNSFSINHFLSLR